MHRKMDSVHVQFALTGSIPDLRSGYVLIMEMLSSVYCVTEEPSQENNPSETLLRIMFAALHNVKILAPALPAVARGTVLKYAY